MGVPEISHLLGHDQTLQIRSVKVAKRSGAE